jgi:hypothetical protein
MPSPAASQQVDAYLDSLPQPHQAIAGKLRELLFDLVPGIEERFSFKVPFYHYHGMFCYLHYSKTALHLCFCRGKDLVIAFPQLEQKNRVSIVSVTLHYMHDIYQLEISQLIAAAAEWNKEAALQKLPAIAKKKA